MTSRSLEPAVMNLGEEPTRGSGPPRGFMANMRPNNGTHEIMLRSAEANAIEITALIRKDGAVNDPTDRRAVQNDPVRSMGGEILS